MHFSSRPGQNKRLPCNFLIYTFRKLHHLLLVLISISQLRCASYSHIYMAGHSATLPHFLDQVHVSHSELYIMFNTMAGPTEMISIEKPNPMSISAEIYAHIKFNIKWNSVSVCVRVEDGIAQRRRRRSPEKKQCINQFLSCYRDSARLWSCKSKALRIRIVFHENYVIKFAFIWSVLVVVWSGWGYGWLDGWLADLTRLYEWCGPWSKGFPDEVCLITNLSCFRWIIVGEWVVVMW